ncbi:PP2C family protein-serine/threonine phosphatase [Microcella sp.]|uniref:PP2C family protein-serine/threonine phosphatase n=1 Tax=Microcella sp. TaxID=1913979 RepID=UPI00299F6417|nr:PP2C family protein-serine/threonine phosphatase [Microcella sp.]MDX2026136.1 PP2C family protein-serine/threonine phosphatase [Microcella sp.]
MTAIVERPATVRSAWADLLPSRVSTSVPAPEVTHAARVQRALSTTDRLIVGSISAASHARGLHGAGGDLVDLIESDGRLVAVLGDAAGHGAAASLIAAVVLSSVQHHVAHLGPNPGVLLSAVDSSVRDMLDRAAAIATLAIVAIDPAEGTLRISSAGHHPVMLATADAVRRLGPTCTPLGARDVCSTELTADFTPGSALLITSDGITEQPNESDDEFGLERLGALADEARRRTPVAAIARVLHEVDQHAGAAEQFDDRAVIVVRAGYSS